MNENLKKRNEVLADTVIKGLKSRNMTGYYAKDKEEERLAVVLDGNVQNDPLHKLNEAGDFYALKGILTRCKAFL